MVVFEQAIMVEPYRVGLTEEEQATLLMIGRKGTVSARKLRGAQMLLLAAEAAPMRRSPRRCTSGARPKLDPKQQAMVVALEAFPDVSDDTIRRLQKNLLKPWLRKQWCIPTVGAEFVCVMEEVLDQNAAPYDPAQPRVCFDETRHTFGTHMAKKGTKLDIIRQAMGHESLDTTGIYVHLARELMDKELQANAL